MLSARLLSTSLLTCGLLVVPAIAAAQTLSPDEKLLSTYRLTMPTVRKVAAVTSKLAELESSSKPEVTERSKLMARMKVLEDKTDRGEELTKAESAEYDKLMEQVVALETAQAAKDEKDSGGTERSDQSIAGMEASLKKNPAVMRVFAAEGLTPREYALTMMALLQAGMIEGFGQGKADLTKLPPGINPENVRFVRENKAELEAIQKSMASGKKK